MSTTASELFERHHVRVYRFFLRMTGSHDVAQDLTQELFLRVVRHLGRCTPGREAPWMYQIARNLLIDYRRAQSNPPLPLADALPPRTEAMQLVAFGLSEALRLLSDTEREAFLLREVNGLSYQELATACDTTQDNIRSRVCRARGRLKTLLTRRLSLDETKRRIQDD